MTGRHRSAVAGAAVALAYLVVVVLTPVVTGRHTRPLFDSFTPSVPYHWVHPPKEFAASNVKPPATESVKVPLGPTGSANAGPQTSDTQAIISLVEGAIPPHPPDTEVVVTFDALDPATLGPLPPNESPDGNAYRITAKFSPSGVPIAKITKPGNVALDSGLGADGALFSADDGKTWKALETFAIGGGTRVAAIFTDFGIYVPARSPNAPKPTVVTAPKAGGGSGSSGPAIAIGVIGASIVAVVVAVIIVRRRR
ncbi:MAG: hypothetical protein JWO37_1093 [Acidimicrobiales bacterium]|nr:hypothetical protein [Acidimicrobiales bacterium]